MHTLCYKSLYTPNFNGYKNEDINKKEITVEFIYHKHTVIWGKNFLAQKP